jgi:hypothetical protein
MPIILPNWAALLPKAELEKTDLRQRNAQIVIRLKNPTEASAVQEKIRQAYPQGIIVHTWEEESGYISNILEAVAFITGSIHKLLLVTIFIIVSVVMYINILHQRRQIRILKSLGAEITHNQRHRLSSGILLHGRLSLRCRDFRTMFWYSNAHHHCLSATSVLSWISRRSGHLFSSSSRPPSQEASSPPSSLYEPRLSIS